MADFDLTNEPNSKEQCLDIAATNKTNSPFLRLPPEIRNNIYELALGVPQIGPLDLERAINWPPHSPELPDHFLSLLSVSRQIHEETRLLPFTLNPFEFVNCNFHDENVDDRSLDTYHFTLSEPQRGVITQITLGITGHVEGWEPPTRTVIYVHGELGSVWARCLGPTYRNLRDMFPSLQTVRISIHDPFEGASEGWRHEFEVFKDEAHKVTHADSSPSLETTVAVCKCRDSSSETDSAEAGLCCHASRVRMSSVERRLLLEAAIFL